MTKKRLSVCILFLVTFIFAFCAEAADRDTRRPRKPRDRGDRDKQKQAQQLAEDAARDVQEKLSPVLELVNQNESMNPQDLEIITDSIIQNKRFVSGMDPTSQAEFFILSSWANYFQKQFEPALKDGLKALKADPENSDAKATLIAMALLNKDYKAVNLALKEKKQSDERDSRSRKSKRSTKSRTPQTTPGPMGPGGPMMGPGMPGMAGMEAPPRSSRSSRSSRTRRRSAGQGALGFDWQSLNPKILGQKIETANLKCLNGSVYEFPVEDSTTCVLIWKADYSEQESYSDRSANDDDRSKRSKKSIFDEDRSSRSTRSRTVTNEYENETQAFYELFSEYFVESDDAQFISMNAQHRSKKQQVLEYLVDSPTPWPQIMTDTPTHRSLMQLNALEITQPLMLIVSPDGAICYAAQADSFLPGMLLENMADMPKIETQAPQETIKKEEIEDIQEDVEEDIEESQPQPSEQLAEEVEISRVEQEPKKKKVEEYDETQQLVDETQAGKLYQVAEMHYKKGKYIGYGKAVKSCREIIEKYPNTEYADMAKDLLRQLPRRKRQQFNITDEELGVK